MQKPNILFILTDDQRFDTVGALGNPQIKTPAMDQLARTGTAFTNAYIMGGSSAAVCMPSRAMIHTGRSLFRIEGEGQTIAEEHALLGECLRQAGYRTFGTGKWHNAPRSFARSFSDGAEIFFGGMADHWNMPAFDFDPSGEYQSRLPQCVDAFTSNQLRRHPGDHSHAGRHSTDVIAEATRNFLTEAAAGGQPFFAYVSFLAPHDPRTMPKEFLDLYDADAIELPANFTGGHPFDNGWLKVRDELLADFPRTDQAVRRHIAEYYAMISHLDARIGGLIEELKRAGQYENTIIVMAGDNGLALGQHGLMGKQSCYEHSLHVPLLMSGPGLPRGEHRDGLCYLFDLFPTLCELVGLETPGTVEGVSLKPMLEDACASPRDSLFHAFTHTHRAVRDRRWKLIVTTVDKQAHTQLFDLRNDPWETKNLADCPEAATELARLREKLCEARAACGDNTPAETTE